MLTSRERVIKAYNFEPTDRVPRDLWKLYGVLKLRNDEYEKMLDRFDFDFVRAAHKPVGATNTKGVYCEVGEWTDVWGCTHVVGERGVCGEVKNPPFEDWSGLDKYKPPYELIEEGDWSGVNRQCGETDKFVIHGCDVNPFERLQYLRGSENVYMDLAYGTKEIHKLLEMIHDYNCKEISKCVKTDVDCLQFVDDWGSQSSLLIQPAMWREVFKPLYKEYCDILHGAGKYILFHSDGFIEPIYPDLIELGVHAVNSQLFCMGTTRRGIRWQDCLLWRDGPPASPALRHDRRNSEGGPPRQQCSEAQHKRRRHCPMLLGPERSVGEHRGRLRRMGEVLHPSRSVQGLKNIEHINDLENESRTIGIRRRGQGARLRSAAGHESEKE